MERVISYDGFLQIIDDCYARGFQLCLEREDLGHDNWPIDRFVSYLKGIEFYKMGSGIITEYRTISSSPEKVSRIEVTLYFPETEISQAKCHHIHWVVRAVRH